jgi:hypothetical protein
MSYYPATLGNVLTTLRYMTPIFHYMILKWSALKNSVGILKFKISCFITVFKYVLIYNYITNHKE